MKNTFKIKLILFFFILVMLFSPICMASNVSAISADNKDTDDNVNGTYEFIASDVYESGKNVVIDTIVDGNAFAFGDNITISGEIGGDVFAFGSNVTITDKAYVHGSIFVFAQQANINGVCYDVYGATGNLTLGDNSIVARDIRASADKVHINGQIKRDAYIVTNELVFPDNASNLIGGNLSYTANSEFEISDEIVVGNINYSPKVSHQVSIVQKITVYITRILSTLLYSLAVVLLAIWLTPKFKEKATAILRKKAPLSFGVGLLASLTIIVSSFTLILITGGLCFNISLAILAIFILALTVTKTVFSMACAKLISTKLKKDNNIIFVLMTLLVVLVISLIQIIPYFGGLVGFIVNMIGLGIILLNLITREKLDGNKTEETNTPVTE